ncbi:MAG: sugar kinase [Calditrichaeota bacterium]|nr:MAG: sugar kinase [Calditrichota bacterium]
MSILVVGSIALDTVETPFGNAQDSLGGSALYFSAAASFFAPVNLVGVVGKDFDFSKIEFLKQRGVDFEGLGVEDGETFRWGGRYHKNMNQRDTLFTYLNVFKNFQPVIPDHYRDARLIFLANIDPELQLDVLHQVKGPELTVLDTMNFWISGKREALEELITKVDVLILNDEELYELTNIPNMYDSAHELLQQGPRALVIKKGEHGAVLVTVDQYFLAPAFPLRKVVDPTGAGDSFAGGFLGYLATCKTIDAKHFRKAVIYGTVTASFTVEDFSFNRLREISRKEIEERVETLRNMVVF